MITNRDKDLVDRFCDDRLQPDEFNELQTRLKNSPELRAYLIEYRSMEAGLSKVAAFIQQADSDSENATNRQKSAAISYFIPIVTAAALTLLIVSGLALFHWFGKNSDSRLEHVVDDGIGQITKVIDLVTAEQEITKGIISPGPLRFSKGMVEIEFFSGVKTIIKGPVNVELISENEISCSEGIIRGYAPPHAKGFKIRSQQMELIDIGTEFGVQVSPELGANVQVFDGEVEIYQPTDTADKQPQLLKAGDAIAISLDGASRTIGHTPESFPEFDEINRRAVRQAETRQQAWQKWQSKTLQNDSRLVAYFDFDTNNTEAFTKVGCENVEGRWPRKQALGFNSLADRVRVELNQKLTEFTLAAWVRIDANPARAQSILMSEGWDDNRIHWQTTPRGQLSLDSKYKSGSRAKHNSVENILKPRRIGSWTHLVSVRNQYGIQHYRNGKLISQHSIKDIEPVSFAAAQIGNWIALDSNANAVRNFVGRIDEIAIWKTPLTETEISEIFSQTRP